MRYLKNTALLAAAVIMTAPVSGTERNIGTTAASFLKLGFGARSAAVGDAYVGRADGPEGHAVNPAGLALVEKMSIEASHIEWFKGVRMENFGIQYAMPKLGKVGVLFSYVALPTQSKTELVAQTDDLMQNFRKVGEFTPYNFSGALSYAFTYMEGLHFGLTARVTSENIDADNAISMGVDLGMLIDTNIRNLRMGMAVQNLGLPVKMLNESFRLPVLFRFGFSYDLFKLDRVSGILMAEFDARYDNERVAAFGVEVGVHDQIYIRGGLRYDNIFNPYSFGMGYRFLPEATLDIAMVPAGELGTTYRASLTYNFEDFKPEPGPKWTSVSKPVYVPTPVPTATLSPVPTVTVPPKSLDIRIGVQ